MRQVLGLICCKISYTASSGEPKSLVDMVAAWARQGKCIAELRQIRMLTDFFKPSSGVVCSNCVPLHHTAGFCWQ